jgi:hypothetical protein
MRKCRNTTTRILVAGRRLNLLRPRPMTDLVPPLEDPVQRRRWARSLLREFSSPNGRLALGAKEIRAGARRTLKEPLPPKPRPPRQ